MTDRQLAEAFGRLRPLCVNIIGFQGLSELADDGHIPQADRIRYEAMVYASGIELAKRVIEIAEGLDQASR